MRRKIVAALAAVTAAFGLAFAAAPAQASTGGTADDDTHAGVAIIVNYTPEGRFRCSAVLISPTVLLTAGHCTAGVVGRTLVSFDSFIAEKNPPSPFPSAADPSVGYTSADLAGRISGTTFTHPDFANAPAKNIPNDVGVVVLDQPVDQPTYPLAALGTLDLAPGDIPKTTVTAVGYGAELAKPASGPQRRVPVSYPLFRRSVDLRLQQVESEYFVTHANVNPGADTGGVCSGDSGGPVFLNGAIVGLVSFGKPDCLALDGMQRVDIPSIQNWLATFLNPTP
jgi:hypothetical protein